MKREPTNTLQYFYTSYTHRKAFPTISLFLEQICYVESINKAKHCINTMKITDGAHRMPYLLYALLDGLLQIIFTRLKLN